MIPLDPEQHKGELFMRNILQGFIPHPKTAFARVKNFLRHSMPVK